MRSAAATAGGGTRAGRSRVIRGLPSAEHRELQRVPRAGALGALDLLARGHHDTLVARLAIIADIFINWHGSLPPRILSWRIKKQLPPANQGQLEKVKIVGEELVSGDLLGYVRFCSRAVPT